MESIMHPISGENGYFCTIREKNLIDAILTDYSIKMVLQDSSRKRGADDD